MSEPTEKPRVPDAETSQGATFPTALVAESAGSRWATRAWAVVAVAVVVAVVLVALALGERGVAIAIRFDDGHGIGPGAALRHRGIDVGRVTEVVLAKDGAAVEVRVEVDSRAAPTLTREGTRFWITRPRVSLAGVSGLDTVVGSKWIGVEPGPDGAKRIDRFVGIELPPTLDPNVEPARHEIEIRFASGHGLAAGDALEHRGIVVGEVTSVELTGALDAVRVRVRLVESARGLARAGTQFWIERPQLSLSGVRGIDTIIRGRHIACLPGPARGEPLDAFDGLEEAPALVERAEGGLEVILESASRFGVDRGSPVTYRGIPIGRITSNGLSSDGAKVEARAWIEPPYRPLVRANSRFFSVSGVAVSMGFTGVTLDMESFASLTAGGVALATPDASREPVATGHRFTLHEKAEDAWLTWQPRIPIGTSLLPDDLATPRPLRVSLHWHEKGLVGTRERQREGWALLLAGSPPRLLAPRDLVAPVEGAIDGSVTLAVAGRELPVTAERFAAAGDDAIGIFTLEPGGEPLPDEAWPTDRARESAAIPEDALIVADPQGLAFPLAAGQATASDDGWTLAPALPLAPDVHGASVVSRRDGALVGLIIVGPDERPRVVAVTRAALRKTATASGD